MFRTGYYENYDPSVNETSSHYTIKTLSNHNGTFIHFKNVVLLFKKIYIMETAAWEPNEGFRYTCGWFLANTT